MTDAEILAKIEELLACGIHITPRGPQHTPEVVEMLERVLNRMLALRGRRCTARLDNLCLVVTIEPKED